MVIWRAVPIPEDEGLQLGKVACKEGICQGWAVVSVGAEDESLAGKEVRA